MAKKINETTLNRVKNAARCQVELRQVFRDTVISERNIMERLKKLLDLKAPHIIIWNEAQFLNPHLKIWRSKPQKEIYDRWKDRQLLAVEVDSGRKWCLRLQTAEGLLLYGPNGRFGPWLKEI